MTSQSYVTVLDLGTGALLLCAVLITWRRDFAALTRLLGAQGAALALIPIALGLHQRGVQAVLEQRAVGQVGEGVVVGQAVDAPISGYVTKIGYAYADDTHLKFVEITNPALHYAARVFYVDPEVEVGQTVALGSKIGRHHSLAQKYPGGMTDHVHLEILDKRGRRIDGSEVITAKLEPSDRLAAD